MQNENLDASLFNHTSHLLAKYPELAENNEIQNFISNHSPKSFGEDNDQLYFWSEEQEKVLFVRNPEGEKEIVELNAPTVVSGLNEDFGALNDQLQRTIIHPVLLDGNKGLGFLVETISYTESEAKVHRKTFNADQTVLLDEQTNVESLLYEETELPEFQTKQLPFEEGMELQGGPLKWMPGWYKDEWLSSNDLIHPRFTAQLAQKVVGGERNTKKRALLIGRYIKSKIKYKVVGNMLSDVQIWKGGKQGVCIEFATFYHSMMRAVGIPTRMVYLHGRQNGNLVGLMLLLSSGMAAGYMQMHFGVNWTTQNIINEP
jgi:hypothetical protein